MRFFAFVSAALATMAVVNAMSVDTTQGTDDVMSKISEKINRALEDLLKVNATEARRSDVNAMNLDERAVTNVVGAIVQTVAQLLAPLVDALSTATLKGTAAGGIVDGVSATVTSLEQCLLPAIQPILDAAMGVGSNVANAGSQAGNMASQAGNGAFQASGSAKATVEGNGMNGGVNVAGNGAAAVSNGFSG